MEDQPPRPADRYRSAYPNMSKTKLILLLPLLLSWCFGCDRSESVPGAYFQKSDADYLLPDGRRWHHRVVLPSDLPENSLLRIEVRRFKTTKKEDTGIRGPYPLNRDDAEEIWLGPDFFISSKTEAFRIALQLINLNDYSYEMVENGATRLLGGINVSGSVADIRCEPGFILGKRAGISPSGDGSWRDEEMRLLRFWSNTATHSYTYDVCVRLKTVDQEQAEQRDETKSPSSD